MIQFRKKMFSEYDAMRSLYVELMKYSDRTKFGIIDTNSLIPILRGNNVVIEKFVISTSMFGRDKYRMYLKIGARAKMPDEVRLPQRYYDRRLGNLQLNLEKGLFYGDDYDYDMDNNNNNPNSPSSNNRDNDGNILMDTSSPKNDNIVEKNVVGNKRMKKEKKYSITRKLYSNNNDKKKDNKKAYPFINSKFSPNINLSYEVGELLGDAILYDKKSRTLVLEFSSIRDAIQALNILPFGLGYKIFLLNS